MKPIAIAAALICLPAHAYLGSFDPQPLRHEVRVTFIDSQLPGPQCVAEQPSIMAPLVLTAIGCAIYDKGMLIVPLTPGIGWINAAQAFATPNALLGHEFRHLFDGDYHPAALSWLERVRRPDRAAGALVASDKHGGDMRPAESERPNRDSHTNRVPAEALTECTIFTRHRDVSYEGLGELVRACWEGGQ